MNGPLSEKESLINCRGPLRTAIWFAHRPKDGSVIGFGRALSDGVYQSAIYDVTVLPEYQGQGIGKKIMEALLSKLPQGQGPVLIYVAPGKEGFYKKLGFEPLLTGMGLFRSPDEARKKGLIP